MASSQRRTALFESEEESSTRTLNEIFEVLVSIDETLSEMASSLKAIADR